MLVALQNDQISRNWAELSGYVQKALPPSAEALREKMEFLLTEILQGKMQVWTILVDGKICGVILTTVVLEDLSRTQNLQIFCVYGVSSIPHEEWPNVFNTLHKYAKSRDCENIIGYTANDKLIEVLEKFGGEAKYKFFSIPLFSF